MSRVMWAPVLPALCPCTEFVLSFFVFPLSLHAWADPRDSVLLLSSKIPITAHQVHFPSKVWTAVVC